MSRTKAVEKEPLNKEVSLRFPEGSPPEGEETGGKFDGDERPNDPISFLTRKALPRGGVYDPPIPQPAEDGGWSSVLQKRMGVFAPLRWVLCNCFCNPTFTLTRAQVIWFVHLACLVAHVWYGWMLREAAVGQPGAFEATVWRLTPVYNASAADSHTALLIDNLKPVRIDLLVLGIFVVSAGFNLLVVALGPFDRWIWVYWRQVDLAFHWWRWVQLSITWPMIMLLVCCIVELREQNALALVWMCVFGTVATLFLTELWARPHRTAEAKYEMDRWAGEGKPVEPGVPLSKLAPQQIAERALGQAKRRMAYTIRTFPMALGIFPFVAAWVVVLNHFFTSLNDLRISESDALYARTPPFVHRLVIGTLLFSVGLLLPIAWYQFCPPRNYWKCEVVYPLLLLAMNLYIGYIVLEEIFKTPGGWQASLALDQGGESGSG
jgi:hypothetical protein